MICGAISKASAPSWAFDPTIMDLLVGHAIRGVNKRYIAKLRRSVLLAATQKIADEIDNPQEPVDDEIILSAKQVA
jgi:hypothetical protein